MRARWFICLFLAAILVIAAAMVSGQDASTPPMPKYNAKVERVFEGVIQRDVTVIGGLAYFSLKSADGVIDVQAGPAEYLQHHNFKLVPGDSIRVLGARTVIRDRPVVLAREIFSARGALILRDEQGVPLWELRPMQMDPERPPLSNHICYGTNEVWLRRELQ